MLNRFYSLRYVSITLVMLSAAAVRAAETIEKFKPLPEATSSFGAVVCEGYLYVYGGHVTKTHAYFAGCQSAKFHRILLSDPKAAWEELPSGPDVQGMNLAAYAGKIYRAGGMQSRNAQGQKAENFSIDEVACYDPATRAWQKLPPLPVPRSSHDLAVIGSKLYVLGGWDMKGHDGENWLSDIHVLDLAKSQARWETIKAPFERRALIAAVHHDKLYVLGGFDEDSEASRRVDIFDPATGQWTRGPELPGEQLNGFAPAACASGENLFVSLGDGTLARLNERENKWETVAKTTPRIVHRMVAWRERLTVMGGAAKGKNLDLIEVVTGK